jgi:2-keto-4-pentenoate hydratase
MRSMSILAQRLEHAWVTGVPVPPLSESDGLTREEAYGVQHAWNAARVADGERVVGRKIGLTSAAIRAQANVDEPDYGSLWGSRQYISAGGRAEAPAQTFIAPRVEGELAFLLGADVGEGATVQHVLAATEAIAVSIEIIDSRIQDWRLTIADTIADNASYGGFVLGPWSRSLRYADLGTLGMVLYQNGQVASTGVGVESFGHPARAVAWLARKLASFGEHLPAGSIVLSGALGHAPSVAQGDEITLRITNNPPLTLRFT